MNWWLWVIAAIAAVLLITTAHDLVQKRHAVLRNFPVVGHLRYLLESFGPELRQYIVSDNDEERPFNRNQRRWVYATAKHENRTSDSAPTTARKPTATCSSGTPPSR